MCYSIYKNYWKLAKLRCDGLLTGDECLKGGRRHPSRVKEMFCIEEESKVCILIVKIIKQRRMKIKALTSLPSSTLHLTSLSCDKHDYQFVFPTCSSSQIALKRGIAGSNSKWELWQEKKRLCTGLLTWILHINQTF